MELLWKKDSTKYQKILSSILTIFIIGPSIFVVFRPNFVTESEVLKTAKNISISFTIVLIIIVFLLYITNLWRPAADWYKWPSFKKIILVPFIPIFLYYLFWLNFALCIPYLGTALFGKATIMTDMVIKSNVGSVRVCKHHLNPKSIDAIFFHFCISKDLYDRLPASKIPAELIIKKSSFGYIVKDIIITDNVR